jgi:hypothetical protein
MTIELRHRDRAFTLVEIEPATPPEPRLGAPGTATTIAIEGVSASPAQVVAGEPVTIAAEVRGRGVSLVFVETWAIDQASGLAVGPLLRADVPAGESRQIGGVARPVWPDPIAISVTLSTAWHLLASADAVTVASPVPAGPGSAEREVVGIVTRAGGGGEFDARLQLDAAGRIAGVLLRKRGGGRPASWRPAPLVEGDTLAPVLRVLRRAADGEWSQGRYRADALKVGPSPLRVQGVEPAAGRSLGGVAVQDVDGATHRGLAEFEVIAR